jgi:Ran GTPase-activating protein (RanGAP) involved in mRNA processing and transport
MFLLGNDGCKILRKLAVDIEIPCKIHTLDLSENSFNVTGIGTLRPLLALSSLRRLFLSKLNLGDSGICALMDILCQPAVAASECEGYAFPSPKSPKCLPKSPKTSSSLSYNLNITYLDLSHNAIRTQGANAIARLIQCSKSLGHLELGWNAIGPSGSVAIEKSMQESSSILFLGLSWNGLDESGGVSMASLIGASKYIQEMNLSNNRISMIAACLISSALRQNTSLKYLNLSGNLIGKTGCKSLFRIIRWQQLYRHSKFLEQAESAKLSQMILNHDEIECCEIVEQPAAVINVDACVFEDQMSLDLGLDNCNGVHKLNLKIFRDRAKFAELYALLSPLFFSHCFVLFLYFLPGWSSLT